MWVRACESIVSVWFVSVVPVVSAVHVGGVGGVGGWPYGAPPTPLAPPASAGDLGRWCPWLDVGVGGFSVCLCVCSWSRRCVPVVQVVQGGACGAGDSVSGGGMEGGSVLNGVGDWVCCWCLSVCVCCCGCGCLCECFRWFVPVAFGVSVVARGTHHRHHRHRQYQAPTPRAPTTGKPKVQVRG